MLQQWHLLAIVALVIFLIICLAYFIRKIAPNGEPVCWQFKLARHQWYCVLAVVPSRSESIPDRDYCAVLQDVYSLYNPFLVFIGSKKDITVNPGDLVQSVYEDGVLKLKVRKKDQPAVAC